MANTSIIVAMGYNGGTNKRGYYRRNHGMYSKSSYRSGEKFLSNFLLGALGLLATAASALLRLIISVLRENTSHRKKTCTIHNLGVLCSCLSYCRFCLIFIRLPADIFLNTFTQVSQVHDYLLMRELCVLRDLNTFISCFIVF